MSVVGCREDLLVAFEAGSIDPGAFHHADHVRVAWELVRRDGLPRAMERMAEKLRRLTRAAGKPDRYHETITWAWVLVIADRMTRCGQGNFEAFASANPDLLDPKMLAGWYRAETLSSDLARRSFLMPDGKSDRRSATIA